jgi:RND family efflux transporter MFP subunit
MTTRTMLVAGVVGLGLLAATVIQARNAGGRPAPAAVHAPAVARGVAAEGRVSAYPGSEVVVAAERGGRLTRVLVEEGQAVKKGALLAEIESDELQAALHEARARVTEAQAEVKLADLNRDRRERLVREQIVATHDLDQANRDLDISRARLETASAEVTRYEAQIRKTRIVAPIAGTVIARQVDAGETVETGDQAFTMANLGRLRIEAEADEADAGALAVGAPVAITADGYEGRSWKGSVEEIADAVTLRKLKSQDPGRPTDTRILAVKVAFVDEAPLKLGTTVELRIEPRER